MDVAEQSLMAMNRLAVDHPEPLLRSNGLAATLTFIDFFDTNTQRTAAATAANICRGAPADAFQTIAEMVPNITQLLSHSDQKICESACLAFSRLTDSFHDSSEHLRALAGSGMMHRLVALLRPGDREDRGFDVGTATYSQIVKTLAVCCRGSPTLSVSLLQSKILPTVRNVIKKEEDEGLDSNSLMAVVAVMRPLDQLYHTLMLANELLPPLPSDDRMHPFIAATARGTEAVRDLFGIPNSASSGALEAFVAEHPETLTEYATLVFPILVDISVTIVNEEIRIKSLSAMAKLFACMPAADLLWVVKESPVIGYIAGFLTSGNSPVMGLALVLTNMLMSKLEDELAGRFAREGIVHEVASLCARESVAPSPCMDALVEQAQYLREARFGPGSRAAIIASTDEVMAAASAAAKRLDEGDGQALATVRGLLGGANTLSSYQVVKSGLADSLERYLTCGEASNLTRFVEVFCEKDKAVVGGGGGDSLASEPLRMLVAKLNASLSVHEMFPVVLSDVSGDLTAGLKLLAQPLKLRLVRDSEDASLTDYSGNVVLIEPLATINAVEDFLWNKVHPGHAAAASAADGGPLPQSSLSTPPPAGEASPPETPARASEPVREASDSPAAAGSGGPAPATPGGALRAEEEGEEDEASPADITRPTPSRPANQQAASGAATPLPAATSGVGGHNLVFFVNGAPVPYKCSIVQAVGVLNGAASGGGAEGGFTGRGSTVSMHGSKAAWDQVRKHVLYIYIMYYTCIMYYIYIYIYINMYVTASPGTRCEARRVSSFIIHVYIYIYIICDAVFFIYIYMIYITYVYI